jgi:hypothetical protein
MAAGLGFKDFTTGEVLTAADVDGYLMQGVWVFASAAARDAAVTSPQEGNFAYLKDTNVTTYYTGSAWANLDTTGMTNPMTTTGDTIYSSSGSTPARLGIGTAGQVLQVNSGATAPEWATPAAASSGLVFIKSETVGSTVSSVEVTGAFSSTYDNYLIHWNGGVTSASVADIKLTLGATTSGYNSATVNGYYDGSTPNVSRVSNGAYFQFTTGSSSIAQAECLIQSPNLAKITSFRAYTHQGGAGSSASGFLNNTTQYTAFTLAPGSGTITGGTIYVYGYAKS